MAAGLFHVALICVCLFTTAVSNSYKLVCYLVIRPVVLDDPLKPSIIIIRVK